jgi:hypothetical protein
MGMLDQLAAGVTGLRQKAADLIAPKDPEKQPPASAEELKQEAEKLVLALWTDLRGAYLIYHQNIWAAILCYANQSWFQWDRVARVYQEYSPPDEYTPLPRINHFAPAIDAMASIFAVPDVEFTPSKPDDMVSVTVADIATQLGSHAFKVMGLRNEHRRTDDDKGGLAAQIFVLAGIVFTHVYPHRRTKQVAQQGMQPAVQLTCPQCDKTLMVRAGQDVPAACPECQTAYQQTEGQQMLAPTLDAEGEPIMEDKVETEMRCDIRSPLFTFPRPGAMGMEDSDYFIEADRWTLEKIRRELGFAAAPDNLWPDGWSTTYEHALAFWYTGFANQTLQSKDSALVLRIYIQPGKLEKFPEGLYAVVVNQKCVAAQSWAEAFGGRRTDTPADHPYTKANYLRMPQLFFARSVAFDLVELQRECNAYESLIKMHAMTSAASPIVVEANSLVGEITGRSDKIVKWKATGPGVREPHRMEAGHLDEGVYRTLDRLHETFDIISHAVKTYRGQREGQVTAGVAIQQLRAQAEQMFAKPSEAWANLWKETARKAVYGMQRHYSFAQLVEIIGPNRNREIQQFVGANLDTMIEGVASQVGPPRTKSERKAEMVELFDRNPDALQEPAVRQEAFELFGHIGLMRDFNRDATRARMENVKMRNGESVLVMPEIEDLAVHNWVHVDQAKRPDFDDWPEPAKEELLRHIMETQLEMAQKQQREAAPQKTPQQPKSEEATQ